jgi:hypothetical protein
MRPFAALIVFLAAASAAHAATYQAVELAPGDYTIAYGVDNAVEAGAETFFTSNSFLWTGTAASETTLPAPRPTIARAISGSTIAGFEAVLGNIHAVVWTGPEHTLTDLNPGDNYTITRAYGTSADYQVGVAFGSVATSSNNHAMVWHGTAASAVDLHPSGFTSSMANAISGDTIVGVAHNASGNRAYKWSASTGAATDITPAGYPGAVANGVHGSQVVGVSSTAHALLWNVDGAGVIDLQPATATSSLANATNGSQQVGTAVIDGVGHAFLWNSAADDFVDLHLLLPDGYVRSEALGIDAYGNIVGDATDSLFGQHAILWTLATVPEPASLLLLSPLLLLAVKRPRHSVRFRK